MALPNEILGFAAEIIDHLRQRGETISTAESLTAGAVSSAIVTNLRRIRCFCWE